MGFKPGGDEFNVRFLVVYQKHKFNGLRFGSFQVIAVVPKEFVGGGPSSAFVAIGKWVVKTK
ncbi:MAG: hypothetical protein UX78_C0005G0036 [Candidatus Amesbacteria bacterium GW2011_GWA2_47_11]|uniref:Uncharacterized protein n=3 Tax=Candidatus Amesiibacteriota TaxID=1752730 RepID=A0A0G1UFI1_9BACT|nr:MAG: hypothetical protein UX78_C0005G0036 [Candidatus Amesbacteria bacterium GW2011_GWA2_47_11]KKU92937.1 MAG: hypothetical protein UY22_C0024G0003 [Candidatus Amesbacteria bacterium GW2011_GWC1_48_10]KKW00153.1 MAG: hypothetical protein UY33_C0015G0040 [Candidatus Amesbacteria bacterium GW2011_GWA1_48_9]